MHAPAPKGEKPVIDKELIKAASPETVRKFLIDHLAEPGNDMMKK